MNKNQIFEMLLDQSSSEETIEHLKKYLADGGDVNARDKYANTLLMVACREKEYPVVDFLIENGAKVNARTKHLKQTAIMFARNDVDVIDSLVNAGAHINPRTSSGKTPLKLAYENGYKNAVRFLSHHGAQIN